jgi:hypothetical protein
MESSLGERLGEFQSIIAEHFLRAEAWARAADHLLRAGDEAARLSADAEARGHYEKAMNALAQLPDTVENRRRRVDTALKQVAVSYIADRPDLNLARLAVAEALAGELPTVESATGSAGSTTSAVIPGRRSATTVRCWPLGRNSATNS